MTISTDTDRSWGSPGRSERWATPAGALLCLLLVGCSAFKETGDGGLDAGPPISCTGTSLRAHQPLGKATQDSYSASLAPRSSGGALAVWEERPTSGTASIYLAEVESLGTVTNARKLVSGQDPALVRTGHGLRLLWRDGTTLKLLRLDETGAPQGSAVTVHSPLTSSFAVADSGVLGILLNGVDAKGDLVHLLLTDHDGKQLAAPTPLPQQGINATLAAIAWTGSRFAAAWTDMRAGTPAVYLAMLDQQGKRLTNDLRLSEAGVRGSYPSLAPQYNGGVVACYQQKMSNDIQDVFCSRLDGAGQVTNTARLTQSAYDSQNPRVAANGSHTWVVWDDVHDVNDGTAIHWQFLKASGEPVLAAPRHSADLLGWRPAVLAAPDGLYLTKYRQDHLEGWKAELGVLNCF